MNHTCIKTQKSLKKPRDDVIIYIYKHKYAHRGDKMYYLTQFLIIFLIHFNIIWIRL